MEKFNRGNIKDIKLKQVKCDVVTSLSYTEKDANDYFILYVVLNDKTTVDIAKIFNNKVISYLPIGGRVYTKLYEKSSEINEFVRFVKSSNNSEDIYNKAIKYGMPAYAIDENVDIIKDLECKNKIVEKYDIITLKKYLLKHFEPLKDAIDKCIETNNDIFEPSSKIVDLEVKQNIFDSLYGIFDYPGFLFEVFAIDEDNNKTLVATARIMKERRPVVEYFDKIETLRMRREYVDQISKLLNSDKSLRPNFTKETLKLIEEELESNVIELLEVDTSVYGFIDKLKINKTALYKLVFGKSKEKQIVKKD